jgi:hypothetical protein
MPDDADMRRIPQQLTDNPSNIDLTKIIIETVVMMTFGQPASTFQLFDQSPLTLHVVWAHCESGQIDSSFGACHCESPL